MTTEAENLKQRPNLDIAGVIQRLNSLCIWGEVNEDNGKLYWYYEDDDEDQDHMWDAYCEDSQIIQNEGYETNESWQDNDSCGFSINVV